MNALAYKFPDGYGILSCQEDVLRHFIQNVCDEYTAGAQPDYRFKPVLRDGIVWDGMSKLQVEDFQYNSARCKEGIHLEVYNNVTPDNPDGDPMETDFWFHHGTHAYRGTKGYRTTPGEVPLRTGKLDAMSLGGLHWHRKYLDGYQDLFVILPEVLNKYRRMREPLAPKPRASHADDALADHEANGRASDYSATTRSIIGVHQAAEPRATSKPKPARAPDPDSLLPGYAWSRTTYAQHHATVEAIMPTRDLKELLLATQADYYARKPLHLARLDEILSDDAVLDAVRLIAPNFIGQSPVDEELFLRIASNGVVRYGYEPYADAAALFRTVIGRINDGEIPAPALDYVLLPIERSVLRGEATFGKQPTRKTTFYRIVLREEVAQHQEGELWTSSTN